MVYDLWMGHVMQLVTRVCVNVHPMIDPPTWTQSWFTNPYEINPKVHVELHFKWVPGVYAHISEHTESHWHFTSSHFKNWFPEENAGCIGLLPPTVCTAWATMKLVVNGLGKEICELQLSMDWPLRLQLRENLPQTPTGFVYLPMV